MRQTSQVYKYHFVITIYSGNIAKKKNNNKHKQLESLQNKDYGIALGVRQRKHQQYTQYIHRRNITKHFTSSSLILSLTKQRDQFISK